jgi:hypothetical protein
MHWLLFLEEVLLPLGLLSWLALASAPRGWAFGVQALGTGLLLGALALTAPWLMVPWWAAAVYCGVWLVLLLVAGRGRAVTGAHNARRRWVRLALFAILGLYSTWQIGLGWQGRQLPAAAAVDLLFPLAAGHYLVVSGGTNLTLNPHADALDTTIAAHRPWLGTGYAIDVVALDGWGRRARGLVPTSPTAYFIFNTPVLAPCAGTVLVAQDGRPDMPVPRHDEGYLSGNYLILRGARADIVLAHFRRGSLRVRAGDSVDAGQWLARVGNSGATDEPHLHIHAQRPGPPGMPMGGAPLPMRFRGRFLARNDLVRILKHPFNVPGSGLARGLPSAPQLLPAVPPADPNECRYQPDPLQLPLIGRQGPGQAALMGLAPSSSGFSWRWCFPTP